MEQPYLLWIGIVMIILGMFFVFLSSIFMITQKQDSTELKTKAAGVIFIGPIPIAFGTDKETILMVSLIMLFLMIFSYFLFFK
ncbi:MAG: DUF131 domain-containing protein [Candidatus Altiarchaeota archaeon]